MLVLVAAFLAGPAAAAERPLSSDDVTLLLLGGAASQKIVALVEQRGIDFTMNPDLAKKFHDAGAGDDLIEALTKAGAKITHAPATPAASAPAPAPAPDASPQTPSAGPGAAGGNPAEVERKVAEVMNGLGGGSAGEADTRPLAPPFSLVSLRGQRINSGDYKGDVVIVNFFASWCPHCRRLIPALIDFQRQYYDEGLRVVGVALSDKKPAVQSYCQQSGLNYPVAMGGAEIGQSFGGVSGLPTTVMIGRDGRIYSKFSGDPEDFSPLEARIKRLLATPATNGPVAAASAPAGTSAPASPSATSSTSGPTLKIASAAPVPAAASAAAVQTAKVGASSPAPPNPAANIALPDPSADQLQKIIQEFAAKEKLFRQARNNYTYHQINKVEELGAENEVEGVYEQEWDILFDDAGKRIERVTYAPADTLKRIMITQEDLSSMRNIQPFVLTTDELPEYEIKYMGHVKVDQITSYVFSIRPKEIEKGHQYFQGVVWVDDRDLQIVKSEGKPVPELKTKKGENLFPRFTTWREQIDGKYWFPTYTMADDTLYFSAGPVHIKQILRYTDYKQFKSKVRILSATPTDQPNAKPIPVPNQ